MVQEVVRALRRAGAKADATCGIHIHVGLGQHTPASLRRLVNLVNAKEDLLTQALGISPGRRGRWCRPVNPEFLNELNRRKPDTMEALAQLLSLIHIYAQVLPRFPALRVEHPVQRFGRDLVAEPRLVVDIAVQVKVSQVSSPSFRFFPSAASPPLRPAAPASPAWLMGIMLPLTR